MRSPTRRLAIGLAPVQGVARLLNELLEMLEVGSPRFGVVRNRPYRDSGSGQRRSRFSPWIYT